MAPPGLGFVAANDRAREVHKRAGLRTPYWDWTEREGIEHYRKYAGTAPVHLLFALRQSIDMLFAETLEGAFLRHRLLAEAVRRAVAVWAEGQVLGFNITEAAERSNTVTTVAMGGGFEPGPLRDYAKQKCGVVLGVGIGELQGQGLPDRPYGPRQRADDPGHARCDRSRPEGAGHSPRQGRRRSRDRVAGGECRGLRKAPSLPAAPLLVLTPRQAADNGAAAVFPSLPAAPLLVLTPRQAADNGAAAVQPRCQSARGNAV